ncbi:MAG: CHAP domain-containing protein [Myxococcota bacterium]
MAEPFRTCALALMVVGMWAANVPAPTSAQLDREGYLRATARLEEEARRACDHVSCSGWGRCFAERGVPFCQCEDGFVAAGDRCVAGAPAPDPVAGRRVPSLGDRVVEIAVAQEGRGPYGVGRSHPEDLGPMMDYLRAGDWWCTDFVVWVYRAAGVPLSGGGAGGWHITGNFALKHWFQRHDLWVDRDDADFAEFEPQPGDFVRFHTPRGGHSAIVRSVEGDVLYTIEGNVESRVRFGRHEGFRSLPDLDGFGLASLPNAPPTVQANAPAVWPSGVAFSLHALYGDDGPDDALRVGWEAEGPVAVEVPPPLPASRVELEVAGHYRFLLRADDGEFDVSDEVNIEVVDNTRPDIVVQPVGSAGVGEPFLLSHRVTDDGFGDGPLSIEVVQIGGPGEVAIEAAASGVRVRADVPGIYLFEVRADDGLDISTVEVEVFVEPAFGACEVGPASTDDLGTLAVLLFAGVVVSRRRRLRAL